MSNCTCVLYVCWHDVLTGLLAYMQRGWLIIEESWLRTLQGDVDVFLLWSGSSGRPNVPALLMCWRRGRLQAAPQTDNREEHTCTHACVCVCTAAVNVDVLRFPSCRGATQRWAPLWFTCSAHVTGTFPHYRKCTSQSGQKRSWKQRWHVHTTPELLNHHTVNSRVMFRLECILFWAVGIHKVFYFQAEKRCVCTSDCRDQAFISWERKCWWSTGDKYTVNIITSARKRWRWHHQHHRAAETVTVLQVQSCRSSSAGPVLELLRHFFRTWFLHSWFWPSLISWRYEAAGRLHWGTQDWCAAAVDHGSWMDVLSDWSTGDVSANGNMIRI